MTENEGFMKEAIRQAKKFVETNLNKIVQKKAQNM